MDSCFGRAACFWLTSSGLHARLDDAIADQEDSELLQPQISSLESSMAFVSGGISSTSMFNETSLASEQEQAERHAAAMAQVSSGFYRHT